MTIFQAYFKPRFLIVNFLLLFIIGSETHFFSEIKRHHWIIYSSVNLLLYIYWVSFNNVFILNEKKLIIIKDFLLFKYSQKIFLLEEIREVHFVESDFLFNPYKHLDLITIKNEKFRYFYFHIRHSRAEDEEDDNSFESNTMSNMAKLLKQKNIKTIPEEVF